MSRFFLRRHLKGGDMQLRPRNSGDVGEYADRREVVAQGKTLDDAVQKGVEELGIRKEEADVDVLDVGGSGLMGRIRGKMARVRVRSKDTREVRLKDVTEELMKLMEIEAEIEVRGADGRFQIDVNSAGADGLLIGRRGETLEALQHIVHRIVAGGEGPLFITLDVSGYRERRRMYLESKARELASLALSQRREVFSEPLSVGERRIFHTALADIPHVQARALGEGLHRKIGVSPTNALREGRGHRRRDSSEPPPRREAGDAGDDHDEVYDEAYSRGSARPEREPAEREPAEWEEEDDSAEEPAEASRAEGREIPPAPESAVGRDWMRQQGPPRNRRGRGGNSEFLSPSRGFAGRGYGRRSGEAGDARNRRENRGGGYRRGGRGRGEDNGGR
ncbi:MAG: KH domain-containing protein [Candidatus Eisenbacteria bacterium]|nr:KH domain-containing protein [Candidatus Eisenbacteria bacterium]